MADQQIVVLLVALGVAGILFYLGEQDTTAVLIAGAGIVYLAWGQKYIHA